MLSIPQIAKRINNYFDTLRLARPKNQTFGGVFSISTDLFRSQSNQYQDEHYFQQRRTRQYNTVTPINRSLICNL